MIPTIPSRRRIRRSPRRAHQRGLRGLGGRELRGHRLGLGRVIDIRGHRERLGQGLPAQGQPGPGPTWRPGSSSSASARVQVRRRRCRRQPIEHPGDRRGGLRPHRAPGQRRRHLRPPRQLRGQGGEPAGLGRRELEPAAQPPRRAGLRPSCRAPPGSRPDPPATRSPPRCRPHRQHLPPPRRPPRHRTATSTDPAPPPSARPATRQRRPTPDARPAAPPGSSPAAITENYRQPPTKPEPEQGENGFLQNNFLGFGPLLLPL